MSRYLYHTNSFRDPFTWVRRSIVFLGCIGFTFLVDNDPIQTFDLRIFTFILLAIFVVILPKGDLAFDREFLYHVRTSVIKSFSKVEAYEISKIRSIGVAEPVSWNTMLGMTDHIELSIVFEDCSSTTINIRLDRSNGLFIAKEVLMIKRLKEESR